MSTILKRVLVLSLALILSVAFVGCTGEEVAEVDLDQIVANATVAGVEADTCKFDIDMSMTIEVIGGPQPGKARMVTDGSGMVDNANKETQMIMDMTIDVPGQGEQDMAMEFYIVGGWMYIVMDIPVAGEQWMKTRLTEEMWEAQSQIAQQIELLETAIEVKFLGSESVRGTACYVVEIVPSTEALGKLLAQQQIPGLEGIDFGALDIAGLYKEMSVKEWIAKDTYLVMKSEVSMLMEMSPEDIGIAESNLDKMTMDINMEVILYDYNKAVSIELPEKALEAPEVPGI